MRGRRWVWTLNNYDFTVDNGGALFTALPKGVRYVVWQHEKVNHDHLQGYIRFENTTSHGTLIQLLGQGAHVELAKGTEQECRTYCTKEDSRVAGPWEYGIPLQDGQGKGSRTDLATLADAIQKEQFNPLANPESGAAFLKFGRNIESLQSKVDLSHPPIRSPIEIHYIWGPSGIGKSQLFWDIVQAKDCLKDVYVLTYPTKGQTLWFPGYSGQDVLLLDEFDDTKLSATQFNQMVDHYPYKVRLGTTDWRWARWTQVTILSNHPPESLYNQESQVAHEAFVRRTTITGKTIKATTRQELKVLCWPAGLAHPNWPNDE